MKGTKIPETLPTPPQVKTMKNTPVDRVQHELMTRRTPNRNVHVITPHGKVHLGRKGRSG